MGETVALDCSSAGLANLPGGFWTVLDSSAEPLGRFS